MNWSKLRKEIRLLIHPELRGRIDVHCTTYRKAHDRAGEEWITVDKKKVFFGGCCHWYENLPIELRKEQPYLWGDKEFISLNPESELVKKILHDELAGINHIWGSLETYLNAPIKDALESTNPIIKAFAIVDRRVGVRTIKNLIVEETTHSLVREFYRLRLECMNNKKLNLSSNPAEISND